MRILFWVLLILALAIGIGLLANQNDGYVLIVRQPYRIELSLNFLIVLIVLSFALLHAMLRLAYYIKALPSSVKQFREHQRLRRGHAALLEGLHALVEGRYDDAHKAASKALELGEDAGLSAIVAARASHKLRHRGQRDFYLAEAERLAPEDAMARLITQAEMQLDDRQYENTLKTLAHLHQLSPLHPPAMRLELKARTHLEQWEQILKLLDEMQKQSVLESWHINEIRQQAHQHVIAKLSTQHSALLHHWQSMGEEHQLNARIASAMVVALTTYHADNVAAGELAAKILSMNLTKKWDSTLALLLGNCHPDQATMLLQQAEFWLPQHAHDANLLLSLGKLCMQLQLWGKAQNYLEASLSVKGSSQTHLALAALHERLNNTESANQHYRLSTSAT